MKVFSVTFDQFNAPLLNSLSPPHYIYSCAHKFTRPLQNMQNVNSFNKIRGIVKIACYCLFNTLLNKLFHITRVYIFPTRQNNN